MANHKTLGSLFTAIANSLRSKTGGTGSIVADDFPAVIDSLSTGGITPTGTKDITVNGSHDVTAFATAQVNVPIPSGYIKPSGTKSITSNGTHDVSTYANASINVPVGITPSGTKEITKNGTFDVTNFASAVVNVPASGGSENFHVFPITLSETGGAAAAMPTILSGNDFVKANYAKDGFFAMLIPLNAADSVQAANTTPFIYHGNRAIVNSKALVYGVRTNGNGSSSYATALCHTSKISASGYVVCLRANSSGNIILYVAANYKVPAGNYLLALGLAE